jgi:hypothetical protein
MTFRETEHRLARRGDEYLMQWRFVNTETKQLSKWWQVWRADYECVSKYGEWNDTPTVALKEVKNEQDY